MQFSQIAVQSLLNAVTWQLYKPKQQTHNVA